MKRFFAGLILASVVIAFSACSKDNSLEKLRENELQKLDEYIRVNYPDSLPRSSGLYYIEEITGYGDSLIRIGDRVQMFYATWLIDSLLIDESSGYSNGYRFEPYEFIVGSSGTQGGPIVGLDEAVINMREGGKSHLILPSELAYGQSGSGTVGSFATLLMEIEVYKVYPAIIPEEEE